MFAWVKLRQNSLSRLQVSWESRWSNNWQRKGIGTLVLFDKEVNMEWFTFLKITGNR